MLNWDRADAICGPDSPGWSGDEAWQYRGVMAAGCSAPIAKIRDGTSNTILLGEVRAGVNQYDSRGTWAMGNAGASALFGYGYSDAPDRFDYSMEEQARIVVALLRSLGAAECALVGHSMGGSIAVLVAAAQQDHVGRLVVAEGNLDPAPGMVSGPIPAMTEEEFVARGHADFVQAMRNAGFPDYAGTVQACDPAALHRSAVSLIAPRRPTYRAILARLRIPRTFIYGAKNTPNPDIERLDADGVAVRVIPGSGHDMMVDNPDGFAEVVADAVADRQ